MGVATSVGMVLWVRLKVCVPGLHFENLVTVDQGKEPLSTLEFPEDRHSQKC